MKHIKRTTGSFPAAWLLGLLFLALLCLAAPCQAAASSGWNITERAFKKDSKTGLYCVSNIYNSTDEIYECNRRDDPSTGAGVGACRWEPSLGNFRC